MSFRQSRIIDTKIANTSQPAGRPGRISFFNLRVFELLVSVCHWLCLVLKLQFGNAYPQSFALLSRR